MGACKQHRWRQTGREETHTHAKPHTETKDTVKVRI